MMFEKRYIVNEMIGKGAIPVKTRAIGIYEMHRCHEQSIISNKIFLSKEVLILFLIATLISLEINKSFFFLILKGPARRLIVTSLSDLLSVHSRYLVPSMLSLLFDPI